MPHFKTDDGLTLYYSDEGRGIPVLCLAGLTRNSRDFDPVAEQFADHARIIRLDYRGRGQSEFDPDYQNYNLIQESHDALALLDHLKIDKAAILGTSRGGLIAMMLAASHADRLRGVMLVDIGPQIEANGLAYIMGYLGIKPTYKDYVDAAVTMQKALADKYPGVSLARWHVFAERLWIETPEGLELRYDPALRRAVLEQSAQGAIPDLWPFFHAVATMPHGLIRGQNSDLLSRETAEKMCQVADHMIFAEVPDRGHVPFLDEPEAVQAIETWLGQMQ